MPVEDLRQSTMRGYLLDALDKGGDIGHYGRLAFAMIGRHGVSNDEHVGLLTKDHDTDGQEMRALVQQVEEKGYSPPGREKILDRQVARSLARDGSDPVGLAPRRGAGGAGACPFAQALRREAREAARG
jgi:hypothetical protein